jgi:hypothetical protein
MTVILLITYFLICGITGLILWFRMLSILKSKGQKVNYYFVLPQQFIEFFKVIRVEKNLNLRNKYRIILLTQIILIPIFIIGLLIIIGLTA